MEHHVQAALVAIATHRIDKPATSVSGGEGTHTFYISRLSPSEIKLTCPAHSGCEISGTGKDWYFRSVTHRCEGVTRLLSDLRFDEDGSFTTRYYDTKPYGTHDVKGRLSGTRAEVEDSKGTKTWHARS